MPKFAGLPRGDVSSWSASGGLKRLYPWAVKEFLRLSQWLLKDDPSKELASLNFSRRAALRYLYKAYSHKTVWTTIFIPPEILYALGLTPFCLEVIAAILAGYEKGRASLMEAETHDIPTDVCSLHRLALGSILKGFFPRPVMLAGSTILCDSGIKSMKLCESITGKPLVVIDVPMELTEASIKYVACQLENLVKALEEATGRRLEEGSLRRVIECSIRTRERILEINEARAYPACPLKGSSALNFMLFSHILLGSQEGEEFYTRLSREIQERIALPYTNKPCRDRPSGPPEAGLFATKTGESADLFGGPQARSVHGRPARGGPALQSCSKRREPNHHHPRNVTQVYVPRILWLEGKPYFHSDLMSSLEDRLGVSVVFEEQNYVYWEAPDPKNPYQSLAKKLIGLHWNGPVERRLSVIKHLAKKYRVDGVIVFSQWGCRRNNASVPLLKRELEGLGLPLLSLDGDYVDKNNYMPGQMATRIEGFLEMLRNRPSM